MSPPNWIFTLQFAIFSCFWFFCLSFIFLFKLLILLLFLFQSFSFSFFFLSFYLFFFKLLIFYLFFVWTSVLSFCLIILVFARMSLRVNNSARWFLMILHACWVSVCWGGRRFQLFIKKITRNPHYLITLKNSWFFFLKFFYKSHECLYILIA